ncbi:MAG: hypothetical protein AAFZ74_10105 [Pseudomonadota bacterium]
MTLAYRNTFMAVFSFGYAVLLAVFFSAQTETSAAALGVAPYAAIGLGGLLILLFAPNRFAPEPGSQRSLKGSFFGCSQRMTAVQIAAIVATGFAFGAVLSKTVRAFV